MSDGRGDAHRIRPGLWEPDDLTDDYEIAKFDVPDEGGIEDAEFWVIAGDGSRPPTPARISQNADGSRSPDGFYEWEWRISYLSFDMMPIWLTGVGLDEEWSAPVTVMDYDDQNQVVFLTAIIHRPTLPSQDGQYAPDGWMNTIWRFTNGEIITE